MGKRNSAQALTPTLASCLFCTNGTPPFSRCIPVQGFCGLGYFVVARTRCPTFPWAAVRRKKALWPIASHSPSRTEQSRHCHDLSRRNRHRIYCNQGSSAQRLATPLYPGYPNGLQLRGSCQHRAKKISRRGICPRRMRIRSYWLWAYFRPLRR